MTGANVHEIAALRFEAVSEPGHFQTRDEWMQHALAHYIVERSVAEVMTKNDAEVTAMVEGNPDVAIALLHSIGTCEEHARATVEVMQAARARLSIAMARVEIKLTQGDPDDDDDPEPAPAA